MGYRALAALATTTLMAVVAPAALAQAPGYNNVGGSPNVGPPVPGAGAGTSVGGDVKRQPPPPPLPTPTPTPHPDPERIFIKPDPVRPKPGVQKPAGRLTVKCKSTGKGARRKRTCRYRRGKTLVRTCVSTRRKKVCRFRKDGRVVRVCTKKVGKRKHCRASRALALAAQPAPRAKLHPRMTATGKARSSALYSSGLTNPLMSAVVRFYYTGSGGATKGWCSGTLLTRGLVLTAGHCLFANRTDGDGQYGYYPTSEMTMVPGNTREGTVDVAKWGGWAVADAYVPNGWKNEDGGLDWGIAVIAPNSQGYYPGDYAGTYAATWRAQFPFGSRIFRVGYPSSGPFNSSYWGYGGYQYYCDQRWDGETNNNWAYTASSYNIVTQPCEMNGGSSGGPVFVQFANGSWTIVGVNNRGYERSDGYGANGISSYFDDRFGQFWNAVLADLN